MAEHTSQEKEIARHWLRTQFQIRVPAESPVLEKVLDDTTGAVSSILSAKQQRKFKDSLPRRFQELKDQLRKVVSFSSGEQQRSVPAQIDSSVQLPSETIVDENLEEFHARVEGKFEFIALADYSNEAVSSELLRGPLARANLHVLREAERLGASHTMVCLPRNVPISHIAGYIPQRHFDPKIGRLNEESIAVNADLFRLYYLLGRCPEARIHHEGMPFDPAKIFQFQKAEERNICIPDTSIKLFSEQGQQMLFENPVLLIKTIRRRNEKPQTVRSEFHQIFSHKTGERIYGDQGSQSHERTCQEAEEFYRNENVASAYDSALNQIGHGVQFRVNRNESRQICVPRPGVDLDIHGINPTTAYIFDLRKMIQDLEKYEKNVHHSAAMNRKREQEVLRRMTGIVPEGYDCNTATIPHVIYGASHKHEILNNAANNGVAVLLTTPQSLRDFKEEEGRFYADKRNRIYDAIMNNIIPILKQALGKR